jgi:hypothetical protein
MAEKARPSKEKDLADLQEKDPERIKMLKRLAMLESKLQEMDQTEAGPTIEEVEAKLESPDSLANVIDSQIAQNVQKITKGATLNRAEADIDAEMALLEEELEEEKTKVPEKPLFERILEIHKWLNEKRYGFMYSYPDPKKAKQDFASWLDEWTKVVMDYARLGKNHTIYPKAMAGEEPFRRFEKPKDAIQYILEELIKRNYGEWLDKKKEAMRVHWKSRDEWANLIVEWAKSEGIWDPILIPDIRQSAEEFASLPDDEIKIIFEMLAKKGLGRFITIDKGEFAIQLHKAIK